MSNYVKVIRQGRDEVTELPLEDDNTLLLTQLETEFPGAIGLKAVISETSRRAVKNRDGVLHPLSASDDPETKFLVTIAVKRGREDDGDYPAGASSKVSASPNLELIVLGLPFEEKEDGLREYFEKYGDVAHVDLKRFPDGRSKGYGFVKFKDESTAAAVAAESHTIGGRDLTVKVPFPRGAAPGAGPPHQQMHQQMPYAHQQMPYAQPHQQRGDPVKGKLFIGKLTVQVTEADLRKQFSKFGALKDVYIPQRPFRGIGYVQFVDNESMKKALEERHVVSDIELNVTQATPRIYNPNYHQQQQQKNMYGGGGSGGGYAPENGAGYAGAQGGAYGGQYGNRRADQYQGGGGYGSGQTPASHSSYNQGGGAYAKPPMGPPHPPQAAEVQGQWSGSQSYGATRSPTTQGGAAMGQQGNWHQHNQRQQQQQQGHVQEGASDMSAYGGYGQASYYPSTSRSHGQYHG